MPVIFVNVYKIKSLINKINYSLQDKQPVPLTQQHLGKGNWEKSYKRRIPKPLQTPTGRLSKGHSFRKTKSLFQKFKYLKMGKFYIYVQIYNNITFFETKTQDPVYLMPINMTERTKIIIENATVNWAKDLGKHNNLCETHEHRV